MLAQLAASTRGSLQTGLLVGLLATVLSTLFGVVGSYVGGAVDELFSLVSNVMLVIPGLPLVIVIAGFVPAEQRGSWTIAVVLAITGWAASARVLRAQTLSVRNRDYVAAARVGGEKPWRIVTSEILPNLLPILASQFVFAVLLAILNEAGLAFLGLGESGSSTLGTMLYYAENGFALRRGAWWWFVPPGAVIALLGCGLSLINFSIDEIINPRLRDTPLRRGRARVARTNPPPEASARPNGGAHTSTGLDVVDTRAQPVHAVRDVIVDAAPRRGAGAGRGIRLWQVHSGLRDEPAAPTPGRGHRRLGPVPPSRRLDVDVLNLPPEQFRAFRWSKLSMVFQGAMNSLNPVTTVAANSTTSADAPAGHDQHDGGGTGAPRCCELVGDGPRPADSRTRTSSPAACASG